MQEVAYLNGRFCRLEDATVSIEDRGFQFADGVYEVLVAHHGQPFRLAEHMTRLERSLGGLDLAFDPHAYGLERVIHEGIDRSGFDHTLVYIQITRGAAPRAHVCGDDLVPTVVVTFKPLAPVPQERRERGVAVKTVEEVRWSRCYIKSIALLPNVLEKNRAAREGFFDALFVTADGHVRESCSANVFVVKNGVARTPRADEHILHGVTRGYLLECAAQAGIPAEETLLTRAQLFNADEVFLSATTFNVMPVTRLDDHPIGDGKVGPITRRLYEQCLAGIGSVLAACVIA